MKTSTFGTLVAIFGLAAAAPAAVTADVQPADEATADNAFFVVNWRRDEKPAPEEQAADSNFFVVNWRRDTPAPEETADNAFFVVNWRKREAWPVEQSEDGSFHSKA